MEPLLGLVAAVVFVALFALAMSRESERINNAGPSRYDGRNISDEEFLAACSPGTRPEVALKVRAIISEQLAIPENEIHPSHRFVEDLRAD